MEATRAYPVWPPVLATAGFSGPLVASDPDFVPFHPESVNDARRRALGGAVDAQDVPRLHVRNALGYAYLRSHKRMKLQKKAHEAFQAKKHVERESAYYRQNYRHHIPREILESHLTQHFRPDHEQDVIPSWQGNSITGLCTDDGQHVVFYPSGQVLQQACVWTSAQEQNGARNNRIETGTTIRQMITMGRFAKQHQPFSVGSSEPLYVAARGAGHCSIISASLSSLKAPTLQAKTKISFNEMLYHTASSPHVEAELAFVTADGVFHSWDPTSGLQSITIKSAGDTKRLARCEYSSHPCVLWAATKYSVHPFDLRENKQDRVLDTEALFDLSGVGSPAAAIYDVKRRARNPFQFIVGSGVSIEIIDSRMPKQPLLSWAQRRSTDGSPIIFGAIDEIDLTTGADFSHSAILSSVQQEKITTLYPFQHGNAGAAKASLHLASIRCAEDDMDVKCPVPSQYVPADAPLDLHLTDGGEWTSLLGICALPLPVRGNGDDGGKMATVYQFNNLGDLHSQRIIASQREPKSYNHAVQTNLPCGVTSQNSTSADPTEKSRLPVPVDAILPEHDASGLSNFDSLPVKIMLKYYPRLVPVNEVTKLIEDTEFDTHRIVKAIRTICRPSATFFRLHRFVQFDLGIAIPPQTLLLLLRSRPDTFQVRSMYKPVRDKIVQVIEPKTKIDTLNINRLRKGLEGADPRLAACTCAPISATEPCASLSCIMPHVLLVSRADGLHLGDMLPVPEPAIAVEPLSPDEEPPSNDFASAIAQAKALYGRDRV